MMKMSFGRLAGKVLPNTFYVLSQLIFGLRLLLWNIIYGIAHVQIEMLWYAGLYNHILCTD